MATRQLIVEFEEPSGDALRDAADLTGLEFVQRIVDRTVPAPPIAKLMDFDLVEVGPGMAVFVSKPSERVYNPIGVVHGGYVLTLIDSAAGCAAQTMLAAGAGYGTLETKANMTRPITRDTPLLRCEGRVINAGSRIITAEAKLTDAEGKLYAHGTTTCMIHPPRSDA
jgi:uncharacterized protein (TIGR00369 family)